MASTGRLLQERAIRYYVFARKKWISLTAPTDNKSVVFLSGVQRSGTNSIMGALEKCFYTDVFMESDPRAYDDFLMRDLSVIRDLVQKSSSQCIVFKALHEAHDLCNLMDLFHPAKVIWVFRHYTDTINSNLARWPGGRNQLDDIMQNNSTGVWRALGMTEHTRSQVSALYRADINDETAQALFWYYRNQLFFDQNLQDDHRAYIISYEPTVTRPDLYITHLSKWLGIEPNSHMIAHLHTGSVRKKRPPEIEPDVAALCDDMMERLNDVWTRQMNAVGALPDGAQ